MTDARPPRRARLAALLTERETGVAVINHPANVRDLTGYIGSNGIAIVAADGATTLVTDSRYAVSARQQADPDVEVVIGRRDLLDDVATVVGGRAAPGRVALEAEHVSWARAQRITAALAGFEIVAESGLVEQLRAIKDADEVAAVRRAAEIADAALAEVIATPLVGRTEREVAWDIHAALNELGADGLSFDTIVAAGPNGARPHAVPGDGVIGPDTLVVVDMGCMFGGYCSDMTRTFATGALVPALREAYDVCFAAQAAAVAAVRPGIDAVALDRVARDVIDAAGLGEAFGHGLGHGVGLEIHEAPRISREGTGTLAAGMVVTVEPGIYLEGIGGVRIEDLVVVTDDGGDVLSHFPKEPPARGA